MPFSPRDLLHLNFQNPWARALLERYYREGGVYSVPFGPLRGVRFRYAKGTTFHTMLGLSELHVLRPLQKVLLDRRRRKPMRVAIDAGANRGLYSLWLAHLGFRRVHAYEANPALEGPLRANLDLNFPDRIELHMEACADQRGTMSLHLADHDAMSSLLAPRDGADTQTVSVPTVPLDERFSEGDVVDFLKMDIEGGGVLALPGAMKTIARCRPIIFFESHSPEEDAAFGRVMKENDYQGWRVGERAWVELIDEVHPNVRGVGGQIIACPTEEQDRVAGALSVRPVRWR